MGSKGPVLGVHMCATVFATRGISDFWVTLANPLIPYGLDAQHEPTKNDLPANQKGYDNSKTTVEKLSARRIQICGDYFVSSIFTSFFKMFFLIMSEQKYRLTEHQKYAYKKNNPPRNREGYNKSETTDEKLSAGRFQIFLCQVFIIIFGLLFFKTCKNRPPTHLTQKESNSPRQTL